MSGSPNSRAYLPRVVVISLLFLLLMGAAGCRMPMFDLGLSLDRAGVEDSDGVGESKRYLFFQGAATTSTIVFDAESMTFSPGPTSPLGLVDAATARQITSGVRAGQWWVFAQGKFTQFFDPPTGQFESGPQLEVNYTSNAQMWRIASGPAADKIMVRFGSGINITNRYDPATDTLETSATSPAAANSGGTGGRSHSFLIDSGPYAGKRLLVIGGRTDTMYYDPDFDSLPGGPSFSGSTTVGPGSHSLPRDDGRRLIPVGGGSDIVEVLDPSVDPPIFGPFESWPLGIWSGAHSFRITGGPNDGFYLVVTAGSTPDTLLYDPASGTAVIGPLALSGPAGPGSSALYLDTGPEAGSFLIVHGDGTVTTTLFDPVDWTMSPGPDFPVIMRNNTIIPLD